MPMMSQDNELGVADLQSSYFRNSILSTKNNFMRLVQLQSIHRVVILNPWDHTSNKFEKNH